MKKVVSLVLAVTMLMAVLSGCTMKPEPQPQDQKLKLGFVLVGDENEGYVANVFKGVSIGFKYFDLKGLSEIKLTTRGYGKGDFEIRTTHDGPVLGRISVDFSNVWETYSTKVRIQDGKTALYFKFAGDGNCQFKGIELV